MHYFTSCARFSERDFSALCHRQDGLLPTMMRLWIERRRPWLVSEESADCSADWISVIKRHELQNIVAHGVTFIDGSISAYFSFSRLLTISSRTSYLLEILIPYLSDALNRALAAEARATSRLLGAVTLSAREAEVLEWIKNGKTDPEIAQIMGLSKATVKNHVQNLLKRLDVHTRSQAVARIMESKSISRSK